MSKAREAHAAANAARKEQPTGAKPTGPVLPPARPFKPHPVLFALMALVLASLLGVMIWMYATTVYPNRNKPQSVETDAASLAPR